jgi:hypothetical protein
VIDPFALSASVAGGFFAGAVFLKTIALVRDEPADGIDMLPDAIGLLMVCSLCSGMWFVATAVYQRIAQ